jgi:hypothetical protein
MAGLPASTCGNVGDWGGVVAGLYKVAEVELIGKTPKGSGRGRIGGLGRRIHSGRRFKTEHAEPRNLVQPSGEPCRIGL